MEHYTFITIKSGEKIDTLAYRVLNDPRRYSELLALNPKIDLYNLQPGMKIRVPK